MATVQPLEIWGSRGEGYPPEVLEVSRLHEPLQLDLVQVAGGLSGFRRSLRVWQAVVSDRYGAFDLADPQAIQIDVDVDNPSTPVLRLMEVLRDRGWNMVEGLVTHTMMGRDFCGRQSLRSYFQGLFRWGTLQFDGMRSDQPKDYYNCLLEGQRPEQGKKASHYRDLLAGRVPGADPGRAQIQLVSRHTN